LENLEDDDDDINRAWETLRENIKASSTENQHYYELKQHKLWVDECSKLTDQRKQAKLQWLQNLS
jgi:hypothetical protein